MESNKNKSAKLFDVVFDPARPLTERQEAISILRQEQDPALVMDYLKSVADGEELHPSRFEKTKNPLPYTPGKLVSAMLESAPKQKNQKRAFFKGQVVGFMLSAVVMLSYNNISFTQRKLELRDMVSSALPHISQKDSSVWFDALESVVVKTASLLAVKY
jgi:hypothetical protein